MTTGGDRRECSEGRRVLFHVVFIRSRGAGTAVGGRAAGPPQCPGACVPGLQVRLWLAPLQGVGIGEWKRDGAQTDFVLGCNWHGA